MCGIRALSCASSAPHLRQRGKALEAFGFVLTHALLIALLYVPLFTLAWSTIGADAL